jgi:hypothetical protein
VPYFVPELDAALLPTELRDHAELARVAAEVEADVLTRYTGTVRGTWGWLAAAGTGSPVAVTTVLLAGYDEDPELAEAGLAAALKRVVARVAAHRLQAAPLTLGVRSEQRGSRSVVYDTSVDPLWPDAWARPLAPYDVRETTYRV